MIQLRRVIGLRHLLNVVHSGDGCISIGIAAITDKSETTGAASISVLDDDSLLNGTKLLELGAKSLLVCVPCKATVQSSVSAH